MFQIPYTSQLYGEDVIKASPHQVPVTHILTNLTTAGVSRERFFELLEQVR